MPSRVARLIRIYPQKVYSLCISYIPQRPFAHGALVAPSSTSPEADMGTILPPVGSDDAGVLAQGARIADIPPGGTLAPACDHGAAVGAIPEPDGGFAQGALVVSCCCCC